MKRKLLLMFLTLTFALCCACTVIACGDDNGGKTDGKHTAHTYDKKVADAKYLKSAATCTKKAEYYFSCECGEKGTETFEYGDLAAHVFNSYVSDNNATCVKDGTETSKCANCSATDTRTENGSAKGKHSFTDYKPDDNATCVKNGTETAKCDDCDATDTRDVPDSKTAHTYDKQVTSAEYLASEANCSQKAKYYFSCECGAKGEDVFEHGGFGAHSLTHVEKTAATCTAAGVREHWVCSVCENKFSDANGATVITDTVIAASGHSNWQDNVCGVCGYDAGGTKELYYKLSDERDSYSIVKSSVTESNIVIPATYNGLKVTEVADGAFKDNSLIIKVTIGDNVKVIGNEAFSGCVSLTEAVIGDGVTTVGYDAFSGCRLLAKVIVGNSVKDMNASVFEGCRSLKSVSLPDGLTSIGYATFSGCTSLESVSLPASLTDIGEMAFYNATSLTEIKYRGDIAGWCGVEGAMRVMEFVYVGDEKLTEMTEITIPDGVEEIAEGAFCGLSSLESVSIGKDVALIGGFAFSGCKALASVIIPAGVTEIGPYAFSGCAALEKIVIPSEITALGERTFSGCTSLTSVTLPAGLTEIGESAFNDCDSLAEIKYEGDIEGWCKIYGLDYLTGYGRKLIIGGKEVKGDLIIPAGVKTVASSAFRGCALDSVEIVSGVTEIGDSAFGGCKNLTKVKLPDTLTKMGWGAFRYCYALKSVTIPATLGKIGESAFYECTALESVVIENGVMNIGSEAFSGCKSLSAIAIPESVTILGYSAFKNCTAFTAVKIHGGVQIIGSEAFAGCTSLESVEIENGVSEIGHSAFSRCTSLTSVTVPQSVTEISQNAFYCDAVTIYCEAAEKPDGWSADWISGYTCYAVVVWDSKNNEKDKNGYEYAVIDGMRYAFKDGAATVAIQPANLSGNLVIPSNVTYNDVGYPVTAIGRGAFDGCKYLTGIKIPTSVTEAYNAFTTNGYTFTICVVAATAPEGLNHTGTQGVVVLDCENNDKDFDGYAYTMQGGLRYSVKDGFAWVLQQPKNIGGDIVIPEKITYKETDYTVTRIRGEAFRECEFITSITIPATVTQIDNSAFSYCTSLTSITFKGTKAQWEALGYSVDCTVHCLDGDLEK